MVERVIGNDEVTGPIPVPSLEGPFERGALFLCIHEACSAAELMEQIGRHAHRKVTLHDKQYDHDGDKSREKSG